MKRERSILPVKRMRQLLVAFCLPCFMLCLPEAKSYAIMGREEPVPDAIDTIISQEVAQLMQQPGYTAISGVVYVKGKAHLFHYGKLSNGQKPNDHTVYEIGSIAKTYTGLLLAQAVYDGKIRLDDDVRKYLDGKYPNLVLYNNTPITFRHLITHTSGLPLSINCDDSMQTPEQQAACFSRFTKDDFFKELQKVKITDNSGKNYHYSGVGMQLAGYILEDVYQASFRELFEKYIFSRFGNRNVFSEPADKEYANVSFGKNNEGKLMPLIPGFYQYAGGLKTTTASMLDYISVCLESDDKVIKLSRTRLAGDVQYGRAYAWNTFNYDDAYKMLYHNGGSFGHSSWIALYPDQKLGIFLVTNVVTVNSQSKLNELSNNIIDKIKQ